MKKKLFCCLCFFVSQSIFASSSPKVIKRDGFTIYLSCSMRAAVKFEYDLLKKIDVSSNTEYEFYYNRMSDMDVSRKCSQINSISYSGFSFPEMNNAGINENSSVKDLKLKRLKFLDGRLVPSYHLGNNLINILETSYMTNILPMHPVFYKEAWVVSNDIIDCFRKKHNIHVEGGPLWTNDIKNDVFFFTHGIRTPDYFWKIIELENKKFLSFLFPNDERSNLKNFKSFLTNISKMKSVVLSAKKYKEKDQMSFNDIRRECKGEI